MLLRKLCVALVAAAAAWSLAAPAQATVRDRVAYRYSTWYPWHYQYAHPVYQQPLALVVPPTAGNTSEYGWGVGTTRITPIYHQYMRPYPGPGAVGGSPFYHVPQWPADTTQMGIHYIRGPW